MIFDLISIRRGIVVVEPDPRVGSKIDLPVVAQQRAVAWTGDIGGFETHDSLRRVAVGRSRKLDVLAGVQCGVVRELGVQIANVHKHVCQLGFDHFDKPVPLLVVKPFHTPEVNLCRRVIRDRGRGRRNCERVSGGGIFFFVAHDERVGDVHRCA